MRPKLFETHMLFVNHIYVMILSLCVILKQANVRSPQYDSPVSVFESRVMKITATARTMFWHQSIIISPRSYRKLSKPVNYYYRSGYSAVYFDFPDIKIYC